MACVRVTPAVQKHLESVNATDSVTWFFDWMPAIAMDEAFAILKMWNTINNFRASLVVQTAAVRTDKPDAPTLIGSLVNQAADDEYFFTAAAIDLATLVAGKTYVRFGVAHDMSTGSSVGQSDVTLQLSYRQCGSLQAPWVGHLIATSSTNQFTPISGWLPAQSVLKVTGTIAFTSLTGALRIVLTYRTALATPELPDAWNTTGLGTPITTAGFTNTTELPVSLSDKMWVQIGVMYWLNSGTLGQADLMILLGIRSSS